METTKDRFWEKVDISREGGCWEWQAYKDRGGYGTFRLDGKLWLAHRVSWMWANGEIPEGMCICHHCDNPACVNPKHLFCGTMADNFTDMVNKGRVGNWRGEKHGNVKLTEVEVLEIRRLRRETNLTQHEVGEMFNVSHVQISRIEHRKEWGHI